MEHCINKLDDCEGTFYDEDDDDKRYEIYKNVNRRTYTGNDSIILLKNNLIIIFKKLILEIPEKDTKELLNSLFSWFYEQKKYYGVTIYIVNLVIDLFEEKNMSEYYIKELNEILSWLKRNMIPPRYYNIKGINMYREEKMQ